VLLGREKGKELNPPLLKKPAVFEGPRRKGRTVRGSKSAQSSSFKLI
jgi:hypothetical protein